MLTQHHNSISLGMSDKAHGRMITREAEAWVNRSRYFTREGIDPERATAVTLAHGNLVKVLTRADRGVEQRGCDGLVTAERGLCLTVTVSDCLPIFFYDDVAGVIGLAHAGWRGVVGNIASNMVQTMTTCGSSAENIRVFIGPHIKPCHFEIRDDTLPHFLPYPHAIIRRDGKMFVDLAMIVTAQLTESEIPARNVAVDVDCTFCVPEYFSYRRGDSLSQMAWIIQE